MGIPGQGRMVEVEEALRGGPRTRRQQERPKEGGEKHQKSEKWQSENFHQEKWAEDERMKKTRGQNIPDYSSGGPQINKTQTNHPDKPQIKARHPGS